MKKYFYKAYYSYKCNKIYKSNTIFATLSSFIFIIITYSIWDTVHKSGYIDETKFKITISHIIFINVLNQLFSRNFETLIGEKIISGDISYYLTKPVNCIQYLASEHLGNIIYNFIFSAVPLVILSNFLVNTKELIFIKNLPFVFISSILSLCLVILLESIIGLMTMFMYQVFGLSLIKSSLINIFAGITIPLYYYPDFIKNFFLQLPFYSIFNAPISILLNEKYYYSRISNFIISNFNISNSFIPIIIDQLIWFSIFTFILMNFWNILKKKITIQGG